MKTKNKLVSVIIIALFILCHGMLIGAPAESSKITEIIVGDAEGATGELVKVPVSISSNSGLGAAEFILDYDNTRLEVIGAEEGSAVDKGSMTAVNTSYSDDSIKLCYINPDGLYDEGSLFIVTFRIIETRLGRIHLKLEVPEFKDSKGLNDIPYEYNNIKGSVKVVKKISDNDNTGNDNETMTNTETPESETAGSETTVSETGGSETEPEKVKPTVPDTADNSNVHIYTLLVSLSAFLIIIAMNKQSLLIVNRFSIINIDRLSTLSEINIDRLSDINNDSCKTDKGNADKGNANKGYSDKGYSDKGYSDKGYSDKGYSDKSYSDKGCARKGTTGKKVF